jgi:hypothetical protein
MRMNIGIAYANIIWHTCSGVSEAMYKTELLLLNLYSIVNKTFY